MMHHCEYVWNLFYLVIIRRFIWIRDQNYLLWFVWLQPLAAAALNKDVLWWSHDHHLFRFPLVDNQSLFRQRQPQLAILRTIEVLVFCVKTTGYLTVLTTQYIYKNIVLAFVF